MSEEPVVTLPADATEDDVRRVKETARIVRRNVRIRRQYEPLKEEHGCWRAYEILAERHSCSTSTVRKVLEGNR